MCSMLTSKRVYLKIPSMMYSHCTPSHMRHKSLSFVIRTAKNLPDVETRRHGYLAISGGT